MLVSLESCRKDSKPSAATASFDHDKIAKISAGDEPLGGPGHRYQGSRHEGMGRIISGVFRRLTHKLAVLSFSEAANRATNLVHEQRFP